jgi:hypothetical protein
MVVSSFMNRNGLMNGMSRGLADQRSEAVIADWKKAVKAAVRRRIPISPIRPLLNANGNVA